MKNIIFLSVIIFFVIGCTNEFSLINEVYNLEVNNLKKKSLVIIYPTQGCSTCLIEMAEFANINKTNYEIYNVISSRHEKELNHWKNELNLSSENYYTDHNNLAAKNGLVSFKPMIYILKNNKITKSFEYSCPKEKVFELIHKYMD